jgi:lipopolysaccharide assembly protein A
MSEVTQGPKQPKRSRREMTRLVAIAVLAVVITLFAVLNVEDVKVDWIVGSGEVPLIIVIVISLLVGVLLTYLAGRRTAKRRR